MNADGSRLTHLTSGPFDDREPHWSGDGGRIAFSSDRSGNYDVWVLTLGTSELRQITTNPANDFAPVWSRDGQEIAFASDRETGRGIYSIAVAGAPNGAERLVQPLAQHVPVHGRFVQKTEDRELQHTAPPLGNKPKRPALLRSIASIQPTQPLYRADTSKWRSQQGTSLRGGGNSPESYRTSGVSTPVGGLVALGGVDGTGRARTLSW